jgi:Cysteine rich repeat
MAHGIARWSLVTVILLLVGPAALAQTEPTTTQPVPWRQAARFRMDCGQDLHRFCYGVQPGEGRLIQCLSSHRSQLSPACISRVASARPTLGVVPPSQNTQSPGLPSANPSTGHAVTASALRASCGPDVQTLCAGFSGEIGGVIKCLSSHRMELSPTCDAFFKEMLVRRAAQMGAPKTMAPTANGPAATPAAPNSAADTAAPSAANGPTDTGAPSAGNGAAVTGALSPANGPAATPAAANGAADTGAPSEANGPAAMPAAANGAADILAPPAAVNGPATTSAPPVGDATAATGAAPAAKKPPARGALDFPL